jgi:hypothetical protein
VYNYREGKGYINDKSDTFKHGLFNFFSNQTKLKVDKNKIEKCHMMISVTMYNEDYDALSGTLMGIHKNM